MKKNVRTGILRLLVPGLCLLLAGTAGLAGESQTRDFDFPNGGLLVIDVERGHIEVQTGNVGEVISVHVIPRPHADVSKHFAGK